MEPFRGWVDTASAAGACISLVGFGVLPVMIGITSGIVSGKYEYGAYVG